MSVTAIVEAHAQPEQTEELKAMLKQILPDTRRFEGCEGVVVYQGQDEPTAVVLELRWRSRDDYDRYLAWRSERGELQQLFGKLTAPPAIRYFATVDA